MTLHRNIAPTANADVGVHVVHDFTFNSVSDMNTLQDSIRGTVVLTVSDPGKIARVGSSAPYDFYVLTNISGPTWEQINGSGGGDTTGLTYVSGSRVQLSPPLTGEQTVITAPSGSTVYVGSYLGNRIVSGPTGSNVDGTTWTHLGQFVISASSAATPDSGYGTLFVKQPSTESHLYFKNNTGTEYQITPVTNGDVVGPAGATSNALVVFDGNTGRLIKNSLAMYETSTGKISGALYGSDFAGTYYGDLRRVSASAYTAVRHVTGAVVSPGVNDDTSEGFAYGSYWGAYVDNVDYLYFCTDATEGAARWASVLPTASAEIQNVATTSGGTYLPDYQDIVISCAPTASVFLSLFTSEFGDKERLIGIHKRAGFSGQSITLLANTNETIEGSTASYVLSGSTDSGERWWNIYRDYNAGSGSWRVYTVSGSGGGSSGGSSTAVNGFTTASASTSGATPTNIWSLNLNPSSNSVVWDIDASIVAAGSTSLYYKRFRRALTVAQYSGSAAFAENAVWVPVPDVSASAGASGWDVNFVLSGTTLQTWATGSTSTPINWRVSAHVNSQSGA